MLSVVIITCNRKDTLEKSILSCKDHVGMPWELVVVDNGSTDGTRASVEAICEKHGISLQYHYSESNLGVAGARNIGYKLAKGEVLYFLDDDAIVNPEKGNLKEGYTYLMNNESVQILSTEIWDELWNGLLPEITAYKQKMTAGVELRSFIGCSHFIKKDGFLPETIYPHNLFYGGEEAYLSYSVYQMGRKVEYFDAIAVKHYPSKKTRGSKFDIYKNRVLNWHIVKRYFYPQPYLSLSTLAYWVRVLKLTKLDHTKIKEIKKLHISRYDPQYNRHFTRVQMREMNRKFGFRNLV